MLVLFGAMTLILLAIQRGTTPTYDAAIYMDVGRSLVDHHSLRVTWDPIGVNTPYSTYGLGLSLVVAPLYALQKHLDSGGWEVILLSNVGLIAGTTVLIYAIGRGLSWSRDLALAGALIFGLLTMAPQQSTDLFSEPGLTFFLMLALFGVVRWRSDATSGPWLVGVGIAGTIFFRADSIILCGCLLLVVPWLIGRDRVRRWRTWLLGLGLPLAVAAIYQAWYNTFRYGSAVSFGYEGFSFSTPFMTGFVGNVASPGKGIFVFDCILLLAIPGFLVLWRKDRALCSAIAVLSLARPLFYARWTAWNAGVGWGPRFLFPLCALLVIPTVELIRWALELPVKRAMVYVPLAVLSFVSAATTVLSVAVPFEQWWGVISNGPGGAPQAPAVTAAHQHDYYWTFSGNNIFGNLRLLRSQKSFPFDSFANQTPAVGVLLLLSGLGALAWLSLHCRWLDRRMADVGDQRSPMTRQDWPNGGTTLDSAARTTGTL